MVVVLLVLLLVVLVVREEDVVVAGMLVLLLTRIPERTLRRECGLHILWSRKHRTLHQVLHSWLRM